MKKLFAVIFALAVLCSLAACRETQDAVGKGSTPKTAEQTDAQTAEQNDAQTAEQTDAQTAEQTDAQTAEQTDAQTEPETQEETIDGETAVNFGVSYTVPEGFKPKEPSSATSIQYNAQDSKDFILVQSSNHVDEDFDDLTVSDYDLLFKGQLGGSGTYNSTSFEKILLDGCTAYRIKGDFSIGGTDYILEQIMVRIGGNMITFSAASVKDGANTELFSKMIDTVHVVG